MRRGRPRMPRGCCRAAPRPRSGAGRTGWTEPPWRHHPPWRPSSRPFPSSMPSTSPIAGFERSCRSIYPRATRAKPRNRPSSGPRGLERFADLLDVGELELAQLVLGDLGDVGLVAGRDDHPLDPGALRGERLLLQAAHRKDLARGGSPPPPPPARRPPSSNPPRRGAPPPPPPPPRALLAAPPPPARG